MRIFHTSAEGSGTKKRNGSATRPVAPASQPIVISRSAPFFTRAFQLAWRRAEKRTARVTVRVKMGVSGRHRKIAAKGKLACSRHQAERGFRPEALRQLTIRRRSKRPTFGTFAEAEN